MRRLIGLIVILVLLTVPVFAEESLEQIMKDYMAENWLGEHNFSMSYYNTVTGESYVFNDKAFMVAASTYKLPLNMYYYEMEQEGKIASDAVVGGVPLSRAHRESMVNSNNEISISMLYNLGEFPEYKQKMRKYFSMDESEIQQPYWSNNYYCTHMMMDALKYLYANQEQFEELLGYMKQAQPEQFFRAEVSECDVAHKYGWFEGAVNDVGIFYTEEPFLLAVYTQDAGEWIVSEVARLVTDYNVQHQDKAPEEAEPEPAPESDAGSFSVQVEMIPLTPEEDPAEIEAEESGVAVPEPAAPSEAPTEKEEAAFGWWMAAAAFGAVCAGLGILTYGRKKKFREEIREP